MAHSLSGKTISHYKILGKLGEGGMGVVYRARDTRLERDVALKFLRSDRLGGEEEKSRFLLEARAAAGLDHPNICTIHEINESDGRAFISMALVQGETLRARIRGRRVAAREALDLALQIAAGLGEAHGRGIVHRDIKPANIMVSPEGRVQITDFGLAKMRGFSALTRTGVTLGTIAYMSPEQSRGEPVDARTDIWSLGVVLYEMLSGLRPFRSEFEHAVLYAICNEQPAPLRELVPDLPPGLASMVERCLAKEPSHRYQAITDLQADLERLRTDMAFDPLPATVSVPLPIRKSNARAWLLILSVLFIAWGWVSLHPAGNHLLDRILGRGMPHEKYLAVLPITNLDGKAENQVFADGLHAYLISKLSQLEQFHDCLWIVPAVDIVTSKISNTAEARQVFGSTLAISGSLQRSDGLLRVILNLVDTRTGRQVNSTVLEDRDATATVLQIDALSHLIKMLQEELNPEEAKALGAGDTEIAYAHEVYLMGNGQLQGLEYIPSENKVSAIDAAIGLFSQSLQADPGYALAHAGLGQAYSEKAYWRDELEWLDLADAHVDSALALQPGLADAVQVRANTQRRRGLLQEAVETYTRLIALDPHYPKAMYGLAQVYTDLKQDSLAVRTYRRAIQMRPQDWHPHHALGYHYLTRNRHEEALAEFEQVVALTPGNFFKGYNDLGVTYIYMQRYDEAKAVLQKGLAIKPTAHTYSNMGALFHYQKDYESAAKYYELSLELAGDDFRVWGNLASAYGNIDGREEDRLAAYRRAAELAERQSGVKPGRSRRLARLISFYRALGDYDRMLPLQEQLAQMNPDDTEMLFQMCQTHEFLGERERALELLERALELGYPLGKVEDSEALEDLREDPRWEPLRGRIADRKN